MRFLLYKVQKNTLLTVVEFSSEVYRKVMVMKTFVIYMIILIESIYALQNSFMSCVQT